MSNNYLKYYIDILPVLQYFCTDGLCIWLCDTEKFIGKVQGKNSPGDAFNVGEPILKGGTARKALNEKRVIYYELPEEIYGYEANVIAVPISKPDVPNEIIGVMGLSKSRAIQHSVNQSAQQITDFTEVLSQASEEVAVGAEEILLQSKNIVGKTEKVAKVVQEIQDLLQGIKEINTNVKLLGINMLIEVARIGDLGRGLDVIAKEISTLSNNTSSLSVNVEHTLKEIVSAVQEMSNANYKAMEATERQAAASQELSASVKEVNVISLNLVEIAKEL